MSEELKIADSKAGVPWLHLIVLVAILGCSLGTRLYRLGEPATMYFDEVYFGYTAQQYVNGNRDAYDPFAKTPEGKANEWTHPPLGKLILATAIAIGGDGFFVMRLAPALAGVLAALLIYILTLQLCRSRLAGLFACFLYCTEGLAFVQSRIATADVFITVFILSAFICHARWRMNANASRWWLVGAGLCAGLTLATKWTGVFVIGLLGADLIVLWLLVLLKWTAWRRIDIWTVLTAAFSLIVLPAAIYMASYIHYFTMGFQWSDFVELQRQMWVYHTGLTSPHAYQSKPLQWVFNIRPVWFYVDYPNDDYIANIYNIGNSITLYMGLAAMAWLCITWVRQRLWAAGFFLCAYLILWAPWLASPRVMFFYHYLHATALLCIAGGWMLYRVRELPLNFDALAWVALAMALAWFVLFYPDMTAVSVPRWWADGVYGFIPSWR